MDKEWAVVGDPTNNQVHIYKLNYSKKNAIPVVKQGQKAMGV